MEKWCDGRPDMGLTNNFHNLLGSFVNTISSTIFIAHIDELASQGVDINKLIPVAVKEKEIDLVIVSFLGEQPINPAIETFTSLPENVKVVVMWPDLGYAWAEKRIAEITNATHIFWGGESVPKKVNRYKALWAPQDERLYYPDNQVIDVSFIGSMRQERIYYLRHLIQNNIKVHIDGGQRERKLTPEQYAYLIRSSKIGLNFPAAGYAEDQFKGRCIEILASKSLLMERANKSTEKYLKPGEHYVDFSSPDELIEKIKYYSENENERNKIAENGYNKYLESFSARKFWEEALS